MPFLLMILPWLGKLLGPVASAVLEKFVELHKDSLNSKDALDKNTTDLAAVAIQEAAVQAQVTGQYKVAMLGHKTTLFILGAFTLPVAFYFGKIFVWDTALHLGSTDPLSPAMLEYAKQIVDFACPSAATIGVASILSRKSQ